MVRVPSGLATTVQLVPWAPVGTVTDVPPGPAVVEVPLPLSVRVQDCPLLPLLPSSPGGPSGPTPPSQPSKAMAATKKAANVSRLAVEKGPASRELASDMGSLAAARSVRRCSAPL